MLVAQKPKGPEWRPVMGASVLFAPIDRSMVLRARRAARAASQADERAEMTALEMLDEMGDALSHALIMAGVRGWKDVGQQRFDHDGAPVLDEANQPVFDELPFTTDNLAVLLSDPPTFDAFDEAYVMPFITRERERAAPGNGSPASPSGTGEAGTQGNDIASSPAQPKAGGAARRARTSSSKLKRSPKKASGTS